MRIRDLFYETFSAIQANRGRSLLTILGIVIGIAAVISMTALIDGVKASLVGELGLSQSRTVMIDCWPGREVTMDDIAALEAGMSDDYEFITAASYNSGPSPTVWPRRTAPFWAWSQSTSRPWARKPSPGASSCRARRTRGRASSCSTRQLLSACGDRRTRRWGRASTLATTTTPLWAWLAARA